MMHVNFETMDQPEKVGGGTSRVHRVLTILTFISKGSYTGYKELYVKKVTICYQESLVIKSF